MIIKFTNSTMNKKVNKIEVANIFSKKQKRRLFIDEYDYFASDNNYSFYKKYIIANYKKGGTDTLIELMELSMKMDYFNSDFFTHLWEEFSSKRFWYRLTFLDYMFNLRLKINKNLFISINREILGRSSNLEIQYQACVNLYVMNSQYFKILSSLIIKAGKKANHYVFYRLADFITNNRKSEKNMRLKDQMIETITNKTTLLPVPQKKEIISMLAEYH
jgi:hypothetical protein